MIAAILVAAGGYFLYDGLLAHANGSVEIKGGKFAHYSYIAHSSGPTRNMFLRTVWGEIMHGSLFALAGLSLPIALAVLPEKRKQSLAELLGTSSSRALDIFLCVATVAAISLVTCLVYPT